MKEAVSANIVSGCQMSYIYLSGPSCGMVEARSVVQMQTRCSFKFVSCDMEDQVQSSCLWLCREEN